MRWRGVGAGVLLAALALPLTGCSGAGRQDGPRLATQKFERAWAQRDGTSACGLLAPDTRSEVASSTKKACAAGILEEDLPSAGRARTAQVWGRAAQVQLTGDTVFLSKFPDGWKILAAGCTPRTGRPYDCHVAGG